ncbi:MAG: polysaccharide biosynthesis tyrosine autokinase [Planctomycetota bacterium]
MAQYELNLRDYWRVLNKRRWIILFIFSAIFISTFVYNSTQPYIYQASSSVRYTEQRLLATLLTELVQSPVGDIMLSQSKLIKSWNVSELAAKSLGWIKPDTTAEDANNIISSIQSSVDATVESNTDLIVISVQNTEPQKISQIANAVAQGYQQYNLLEKSRQATNLRQTVENRLSQISAELSQSESELRKFKEQNPDVTGAAIPAYNRLEELKKEEKLLLGKYTSRNPDVIVTDIPAYKRLEELKQEKGILLRKYTSKHPDVIRINEGIEVLQQELQKQIEVLQKESQKDFGVSQEKLQKEIEILQQELGKYPAKELTLSQLNRNIDITSAIYSDLKQQFEKARIAEGEKTSDVTIINLALTPTKPIKPNKTTNQIVGFILGLLISLSAAFIIEHLDTSIRTIEEIENLLQLPVLGIIPYLSPVSQLKHHSRHAKNLFTLISDAILYIFPIFKTNKSSKSEERGSHRHGFYEKTDKTTLSASEQLRFQLIWNYSPTSPLVESYRTLGTNLIQRGITPDLNKVNYENSTNNPFVTPTPSTAQKEKNQIIVITSTGPQEGKTITSCNLAITMASKGDPILLIDMDMRRPIIHKIFGLDRGNGLSDILIGSKKSDDCLSNIIDMLLGGVNWDLVMNTPGIDNLHIMTAGTPVDNPSELLNHGVENLLNDLRGYYKYIICDCPPVLAVTDVLIVGPKTDLTALVYRAGKTAKGALLRSKQHIVSSQINLKGFIFNCMTPEIEGSPAYYHQYYKYPSNKEKKA